MADYVTKDSGAREQYKSGMVRDTREDKGRFDLITPIALRRLAQLYERGARKYADRNWEKGAPLSRFLDSAMRHLADYLEGKREEDNLASAAWNIFAMMHIEEMVERGLMPEEYMDLPSYFSNNDSEKQD